MKVYTHSFTDYTSLNHFIDNHPFANTSTLLIQYFDGLLDLSTTCKLLTYLADHFPKAHIIGASTDGEIIDNSSRIGSIVLSFALFERSEIHSHLVSLKDGSYKAGELLGAEAKRFGAKALILFSDPFNTNGDELMDGINSAQANIIVSGGLAGDNGAFKSTYVILNREIHHMSAVAVFIKGDNLHAHNIYSFNWIPIGPSFTVTRSSGHEVYALDHIPIVQIYREYFGDDVADKLPGVGVAFPMILHIDGQMVGRAPMMLLEDGGIGFGGTVSEGTVVQFGIGNPQFILEASSVTANQVTALAPEAIFIYSCMARRRYLGNSINKEIAPLSSIAPISGFFTYGEFYTNPASHHSSLLNETMTILTLSESNGIEISPNLSNTPADLTDWSIITFNALSHLINKTSIDLQILNTSLQRRVDEEISLNREKDKMMLAQSKQATMGEMMSMIAHQWRQPIATIGLISDNLALDVTLNEISAERLSESTHLIHEQVQYLSKTIDDFSSYFRPDNTIQEFRIQDLFHELLTIIGKNLEHHSIALIADFESEDRINSNRRELMQVCLNLINNAKDAILENNIPNGWIRFMFRSYDEMDQIRISDNAGGINEKIADKIFDPYFSTKDKKHGTGLGLYMSKTITQQHLHGDIIQTNEQNGAVFIITMPKSQEV